MVSVECYRSSDVREDTSKNPDPLNLFHNFVMGIRLLDPPSTIMKFKCSQNKNSKGKITKSLFAQRLECFLPDPFWIKPNLLNF